ncbi:hypothetical protein [Nocardiopsis sp. CC223A]|uniref:hypothetical protein n=1 Tax=Nocardiopsis sp. CC223A TaxID=3044051 RepID=UPI00279552A0|nr:hypothetical protein [Nocardiopsis sp. CC223A]
MSGYELPHKKVEANVGALKRHAFAFDDMFSNITGRSASFNAITNTTATSFSELIDDDIRAAADENQGAGKMRFWRPYTPRASSPSM